MKTIDIASWSLAKDDDDDFWNSAFRHGRRDDG